GRFSGLLNSLLIFSHVASGRFALGRDLVSADTLDETASQWETLGHQIAVGGSIQLFGCDSASGIAGQNLLERLHLLTHAGILGSTNITGRDGDWDLEAHSQGAIETRPTLLRSDLLREYSADLGIVTI